MAAGMVATLLSAFIVAGALVAITLQQSAREAARAAMAARKAYEARGRMAAPPTTAWALKPKNEFACFLSRTALAPRTALRPQSALCIPPELLLSISSHLLADYKVEAGSDARYLSDLIRRMTGCPAYLDSTDLVEFRSPQVQPRPPMLSCVRKCMAHTCGYRGSLRTLFGDGVCKSDCVVVLATQHVFTRPWWCALLTRHTSPCETSHSTVCDTSPV